MVLETLSNLKRESSPEPSTSCGGGKRRKIAQRNEKAPGSSTEAVRLMALRQNLDSFEDFENYLHSKCDFDKINDLLQIIYVIALAVKNMDQTLTSRSIDAKPVNRGLLEVLKVNNPVNGRSKKFYVKIVDASGEMHTREELAQLLDQYVGLNPSRVQEEHKPNICRRIPGKCDHAHAAVKGKKDFILAHLYDVLGYKIKCLYCDSRGFNNFEKTKRHLLKHWDEYGFDEIEKP